MYLLKAWGLHTTTRERNIEYKYIFFFSCLLKIFYRDYNDDQRPHKFEVHGYSLRLSCHRISTVNVRPYTVYGTVYSPTLVLSWMIFYILAIPAPLFQISRYAFSMLLLGIGTNATIAAIAMDDRDSIWKTVFFFYSRTPHLMFPFY